MDSIISFNVGTDTSTSIPHGSHGSQANSQCSPNETMVNSSSLQLPALLGPGSLLLPRCCARWPDITPPDITPWFRTPCHGVMSGGLRPLILKFRFQNPLSCNRKRHRTLCSNSTEVMSWAFVRPCNWQGVLTQGGYALRSLCDRRHYY